jgi:phage/plasmid primase-like uncharacterized protein
MRGVGRTAGAASSTGDRTKEINMALKRCPTCRGKGKVIGDNYGAGEKRCPGACRGDGWIVVANEPDSTQSQ